MKKKRFYVRFNVIVGTCKICWEDEVMAESKLDAKHIIEEKHKDHHLKIINIIEVDDYLKNKKK